MFEAARNFFNKNGYAIFENGALNIFAVRKHPYQVNTFNDELHIYWKEGRSWHGRQYPITTLPGKYWLNNLINPDGAAILKAGQYIDAYTLGKHKGKEALIQCKNLTVFRDNNRDDNYNFVDEDTGMFGINIHRAGLFSHFVNSWSAGCQVFQREDQFKRFMDICKERACFSGGFFTYTLIEGTI